MQPLTQAETTLLIAGAMLVLAMVINILSTRNFQNIQKLKDKIHAELMETVRLRNVMVDERSAAQEE